MEPAFKVTELRDFFKQHKYVSTNVNKIKREVLPQIVSARQSALAEKKKALMKKKKSSRASNIQSDLDLLQNNPLDTRIDKIEETLEKTEYTVKNTVMSKYDNNKKSVPPVKPDPSSPENEQSLSDRPTQSIGVTYTINTPTGETPAAEMTKVDENDPVMTYGMVQLPDYLSPEKMAKKKKRKRFKSAMRREKASPAMQ